MESNCSSCLQDAMDKLWFQHNILFFEPIALALHSTKKASTTSPTHLNPETDLLSTSLMGKSSLLKCAAESKSQQPVGKEERPARLNIVIRQPLFQLQPPPKSKIYSHPSSPLVHIGTEPRNMMKMPKTTRSSKILSELENYELKGFNYQGFVFHREKLCPQNLSMLPGLHRLEEKADVKEGKRNMDEKRMTRTNLSEAWLVNRLNSQLLNIRRLPKSPQGANMKKHLRSWAQKVAVLILEES